MFETVTTAMRRRATYTGFAREAASFAECVARYPFGLFEAAIRSGQPCGDPRHDTPVLLVHGYGHNRSGWVALDRRLRRQGFTSVHTFNYNPLRYDVEELARQLGERVELLRAVTGADRVHVIGHSLGGVLLRWYVQELGGDTTVGTAVTVASPHSGTRAARLGFGPIARSLQPGSHVMRRLAEGARPTPVRWIAYYSNIDMLVQPASSAMITAPELRATNVIAKDHGHLSIMLSPAVTRSIVAQLEAAEGVEGLASVTPLAPTGTGTRIVAESATDLLPEAEVDGL